MTMSYNAEAPCPTVDAGCGVLGCGVLEQAMHHCARRLRNLLMLVGRALQRFVQREHRLRESAAASCEHVSFTRAHTREDARA